MIKRTQQTSTDEPVLTKYVGIIPVQLIYCQTDWDNDTCEAQHHCQLLIPTKLQQFMSTAYKQTRQNYFTK